MGTFSADGRIDVLSAHTPYLETVLVRHDAVLLVDTSGGEAPILADGQIHALGTTRAPFAVQARNDGRRSRAIYRAQLLIHSEAKGTVNAALASGAARRDRRMVGAFTAVYRPAVPRYPQISLEGIECRARSSPSACHGSFPGEGRRYVAPQFADRAAKP